MACIGALRAQKYRIHCFHLPVVGRLAATCLFRLVPP